MLRTQLKLIIRNLLKDKLFVLINLGGLAIGLSSTLLIALYSFYVINYDRFHEEADNIYLVYKERITPNGTQQSYDTWLPLLPKLQEDFPQIEAGTRLFPSMSRLIVDNHIFDEEVLVADPQFFSVFSFPALFQNGNTPLQDLQTAVISNAMARKMFGDSDVVGTTFRIRNAQLGLDNQYKVGAVLDDYPTNSSINPGIVIPIKSIPSFSELENTWSSSFITTYIRLNDQRTRQTMEAGFSDLVATIWDEKTRQNTNLKLLPMKDSYATFTGDIETPYTLLLVALGILLMAVINYVNLTTARSIDLGRQIGIRKILGAPGKLIRQQTLLQSILLALMAGLLALVILQSILPFINTLINMDLSTEAMYQPLNAVLLFLSFLVIGLAAGSYPSFYLGSFKAMQVIDRSNHSREKGQVRNLLVVVQFTLATVLIIATLVTNDQIRYLKSTDMGFNGDRLVVIPFNTPDFDDEEQRRSSQQKFAAQLNGLAAISALSYSRNIPTRWSENYTFVRPEGWEGDPLRMRYTFIDANFFNTYQVDFTGGTDFREVAAHDQSRLVIINEAAADAFGISHVGEDRLELAGRKFTVSGITQDFNYETMRNQVEPTLHFYRAPDAGRHDYLTIRYSGDRTLALSQLEETWDSLFPLVPFNAQYLNDHVASMYEEEDRLLRLNALFTGVAITISILGLFGLASFVMERKLKEITVRKVLGATTLHLLSVGSRNFFRLILMAFFIGGGAAYFVTDQWLQHYSFRIEAPWASYAITLGLLLLLIITSVGYQALKATLTNPVEFLRSE